MNRRAYIIKIFSWSTIIVGGALFFVYGGYDDSPGAQGLGLIAVLGGATALFKMWRQRYATTDITVVRQTPEDVVGTTKVYYQAWLATYPNEDAGVTKRDVEHHFASAFRQEALQKKRTYLQNQPEHHLSLVAKAASGKIVGVCNVLRNEDRNVLRSLYVLPKYQGRGVGSALWDEVQDFLDSEKDTVVEVVDYNQPAIDFYISKGFVATGKQRQEERFRMQSGAIFTGVELVRPGTSS